jgi:uncharacterized protein YbjT (DUF2867 family)
MNYVLTGGAGNITKPLAEKLLAAGHRVTVIGRNEANLKTLQDKGASAAIGSVDDVAFLKKAFAGADAVYTMVPPRYDLTRDWKIYIGQVGKNYAEAIRHNNIRYVVNLSSIGAHLPDGCGPVSGLYKVEQALNELANVHIRHLRPSYYYSNFLGNVPMVKNMHIIGSNFGGDGFKLVLTDTGDIAEAAAEELLNLKFTGHTLRYIASDERTTSEIAQTIGEAVNQPALPWVVFSDEEALAGMIQAGFPEEIAKNFTEMGHALHTGKMQDDYWANHPPELGKIKLEDFAKQFAGIYQAN